jgi:hypothetical protein
MSAAVSVGILAFVLGATCCVCGWLLVRRYGAAVRYSGIGRPYPLRHSALAFLGGALVFVGALSVLVAFMLLFV